MCARLERRGGVRDSPSIWLCQATCQTPLLGAGLNQGTVLPTVGKPAPGDIHNRPSVHTYSIRLTANLRTQIDSGDPGLSFGYLTIMLAS